MQIESGRPHQIRIHTAYIGHPLVGDPLYVCGGLPRDCGAGEGDVDGDEDGGEAGGGEGGDGEGGGGVRRGNGCGTSGGASNGTLRRPPLPRDEGYVLPLP